METTTSTGSLLPGDLAAAGLTALRWWHHGHRVDLAWLDPASGRAGVTDPAKPGSLYVVDARQVVAMVPEEDTP